MEETLGSGGSGEGAGLSGDARALPLSHDMISDRKMAPPKMKQWSRKGIRGSYVVKVSTEENGEEKK